MRPAWNRCPCGELFGRGEHCDRHPDGVAMIEGFVVPANVVGVDPRARLVTSYWPALIVPILEPPDYDARWRAALDPLAACLSEAGYPTVVVGRTGGIGLGFTVSLAPFEVLMTAAALVGVEDIMGPLAATVR